MRAAFVSGEGMPSLHSSQGPTAASRSRLTDRQRRRVGRTSGGLPTRQSVGRLRPNPHQARDDLTSRSDEPFPTDRISFQTTESA
jgi:hypothetical protein